MCAIVRNLTATGTERRKRHFDAEREAERLAATHPGEVLEVELERDDGRWIYELKLLQPGGELRKLKLDARSGELLQDRLRRAAPAARADNRER